MIGLVTDSNSQIPPELVERYGVEVVPLTVVVDGVEHAEGVDLDADAFYAHFADGRTPLVSTSQPGPALFAAAYERAAARGAIEILSVHIGAALSGTLNSAGVAAPASPVPVRLVDTGTASFGIACCLWEAAEAIAAGAGVEEAAAVAERTAATVGNVFVVGALDLARRGGRVRVDADDEGVPVLTLAGGAVEVVATARTADEAADAMARHVLDHASAPRPLRVAVGLADAAGSVLSERLANPGGRRRARRRGGPLPGRPERRRPQRPRHRRRLLLLKGDDEVVDERRQQVVQRPRGGRRVVLVEGSPVVLLPDVEPGAEHEAQGVERPRPRVGLLGRQPGRRQRRLDGVDRRQPLLEQLVAGQGPEAGLLLLVVGVGRREQPGEHGVVDVGDERLPQLAEHVAEHPPVGVAEEQLDRAIPPPPCQAEPHHRQSCCMVAHRPCSWRRKTSSSHFSLVPFDTVALPFWCTSSMSDVAFSRL